VKLSLRKSLALGGFLTAGVLVALYARRGQPPRVALPRADQPRECADHLSTQAAYLDREPFAEDLVFERFPVPVFSGFRPAPLDPNSSRLTREFRTRLREELNAQGVNFAGHYSLVGVGMTGWGMNYWIVDRRNGRAVEFPFHATFLDFDPRSSLIIMNHRDSIVSLLRQQKEGGCFFLNQENAASLRPFYFNWGSDTLSRLAPQDLAPPVNSFWLDYLNDLPDTIPRPLAFFVRELRKGVIQALNRIPHEGYSGFMLIEAFPGIEPTDFTGVSTRNGDYGVSAGRLQFTGNASLDAPAMTLEGLTLLLKNIGRRLVLPASTEAEVAVLIAAIVTPGARRQ
jgi:hypothetical protein